LSAERITEAWARVYGLSPREARAIAHVLLDGPMSASTLAGRLHLSSGAVTFLVRRLRSQGWIEVMPDDHDRRRMLVSCTPRARRLFAGGMYILASDLRGITSDADVVTHMLSAVEAILETHRVWFTRLGPAEHQYLRSLGPSESADDHA
jgi:DNA-binding MarR family transcriptional regulator